MTNEDILLPFDVGINQEEKKTEDDETFEQWMQKEDEKRLREVKLKVL